MTSQASDRLIVALDVPGVEQARALIDALQDSVGVYKIGLELLFAGGMALASELASRGKRVFIDAKLLDIEATVERATTAIARTRAEFLTVHARDRYLALKRIVDIYPNIYGIVFCRTRQISKEVADKLMQDGYNADALHGDLSQSQRDFVMSRFRGKHLQMLVATDVAARGIHVDDVDLVLHVDPPHGPKEYLHRSGRTARAGASGTVISLATLRQQRMVHAITAKAGVSPSVLRARPGDDALRSLVG